MKRSYRDENYPNVYRIRSFNTRPAFRYLKEGIWFAAFAAASFLVLSFVTYAAFAKPTESDPSYRSPGNLVRIDCAQPEFRQAKQIEYSARFEYAGRPMRIDIGYFEPAFGPTGKFGPIRRGYPKARVLAIDTRKNTGRCEATCEVTQFDRDELTQQPYALDLRCQSTGLGALESGATLIWALKEYPVKEYPVKESADPRGASALRFGSWLQGYRYSPVQVDLDSYRPSPLARRN